MRHGGDDNGDEASATIGQVIDLVDGCLAAYERAAREADVTDALIALVGDLRPRFDAWTGPGKLRERLERLRRPSLPSDRAAISGSPDGRISPADAPSGPYP